MISHLGKAIASVLGILSEDYPIKFLQQYDEAACCAH